MNIVYHVSLTATSFWLIIIGLITMYVILLRTALRIVRTAGDNKTAGRGWSVPTIDINGTGLSFFHNWNIKIKLAVLFLYSFAVASLHKPLPALTALTASLLFIRLANLPFHRAAQRLSAMAGFLSMFLFIMPLTAGLRLGDPVIMVAPYQIPINLRAMQAAVVIILKASAIALLMEPLFNTAPLAITIDGLRRLGVPAVICQMILMAHRYIFVFLHEVKRMNTGMRVRGFRKKTNIATLRVMGNFIGMLMVRSVDRTERVYQAMLARGFNGRFPVYYDDRSHWLDWLKGILFILFGTFLLLADRTNFF